MLFLHRRPYGVLSTSAYSVELYAVLVRTQYKYSTYRPTSMENRDIIPFSTQKCMGYFIWSGGQVISILSRRNWKLIVCIGSYNKPYCSTVPVLVRTQYNVVQIRSLVYSSLSKFLSAPSYSVLQREIRSRPYLYRATFWISRFHSRVHL